MSKIKTELPGSYLFDPETARSYLGSMELNEHPFTFMDRCNRPEVAEWRSKLNRWFQLVPVDHRQRVKHNLKNFSETGFITTYFELFVIGFFVESGWTLEGIELAASEKNTKPDFLFRSANNEQLIVEATVATGVRDDQRSQEKRIRDILAKFETIRSPHFRFCFRTARIRGKPSLVESRIMEIERFVMELSSDKEHYNNKVFKIQLEDCQIQLFPELRPVNSNPKTNIIGLRSRMRSYSKYKRNLANSVRNKLDKYHEVTKPLLIAVNDLDNRRKTEDILSILFGEETCEQADIESSKLCLLNGSKQQSRGHVSGVLYFRMFTPWLSCKNDVALISNPNAIRPLPDLNLKLDYGGNIVRYNGSSKVKS